MTAVTSFERGGYAYLPAVFQYSAGVTALPGHRIERVRFEKPVPLVEGFRQIAETIRAASRPLTAFCACELRSPAPFTEVGFKDFNTLYVGTLTEWGLCRDGVNPVARSNVCPVVEPPPVPSFHAFAFTVEASQADPSFIVAGGADCPEGHANYRDHIIAPGDVSPAGLRRKAEWVLGEMERRMAPLGGAWTRMTAVQVYTVHDIHPLLEPVLAPRGVTAAGLGWHYCRPPVVGLEFEMDCRQVTVERVLPA